MDNLAVVSSVPGILYQTTQEGTHNIYTDIPVSSIQIDIPSFQISHVYVSDLEGWQRAYHIHKSLSGPNFPPVYRYFESGGLVRSGNTAVIGVTARKTPYIVSRGFNVRHVHEIYNPPNMSMHEHKSSVRFVIQTLLALHNSSYSNGSLASGGLCLSVQSGTQRYRLNSTHIDVVYDTLPIIMSTPQSKLDPTDDDRYLDYLDLASLFSHLHIGLDMPNLVSKTGYTHYGAITALIDKYVLDLPVDNTMPVDVPEILDITPVSNQEPKIDIDAIIGRLQLTDLDDLDALYLVVAQRIRKDPESAVDLVRRVNAMTRTYRKKYPIDQKTYFTLDFNPFSLVLFPESQRYTGRSGSQRDLNVIVDESGSQRDLTDALYAHWDIFADDISISNQHGVLVVKVSDTTHRYPISHIADVMFTLPNKVWISGPRNSIWKETFRYPERADVLENI